MTQEISGYSGGQKALVPVDTTQVRENEHTEQMVNDIGQGAIIPIAKKPKEIMEGKVIQAIRSENYFIREEKENLIRMASLASLMYKDFEGLEAISDLFPRTLLPMQGPKDLGITEPSGLRVQAFRHADQVIIAIRGTELNKETSTLLFNLIADVGIGRHKSNADLLDSIKRTNSRAFSQYGFKLDDKILAMAEKIITNRVEGHNDYSRLGNMMVRLVTASGNGAAKGGVMGTLGGALLAGGVFAAGLAGLPVAAGITLTSLFVSSLSGATASAITEGVSLTTAADGYPTLLSYIQTIDDYIVTLKKIGHITEKDELITVGHSLGAHLAGVIGFLHGDEIFAFNGPGVNFDEEMPEIIRNMGKDRSIQGSPTYHSVSMETDFIGNLSRRSGALQKLYLPLTSKEQCGSLPPCYYDNPLAHHGIDLIVQVLKTTSVSEVPLLRLTQTNTPLLLANTPQVEEIEDENG